MGLSMADTADIGRIVVIWDDEIRSAAKLMREWHDCEDEDERDKLAITAFNACLVALWGVREDSPLLMLGSGSIKRMQTARPPFELTT
jgi:hypothetical protein